VRRNKRQSWRNKQTNNHQLTHPASRQASKYYNKNPRARNANENAGKQCSRRRDSPPHESASLPVKLCLLSHYLAMSENLHDAQCCLTKKVEPRRIKNREPRSGTGFQANAAIKLAKLTRAASRCQAFAVGLVVAVPAAQGGVAGVREKELQRR
jgi:hypothetical protein